MTDNEKAVDLCANALMNTCGAAFTAGFLTSQLQEAIDQLPKNKQKMFLAQLKHLVGAAVKVKVKSLMTGEEVEIPWDQVGTAQDPSQERYWSL